MNNTINIDGVPYRKVAPDKTQDELRVYKGTVSRFRRAFEEQLREAEESYKELIEDGLKFNSVEAEGNLRGWITAKNLVNYYFGEPDES